MLKASSGADRPERFSRPELEGWLRRPSLRQPRAVPEADDRVTLIAPKDAASDNDAVADGDADDNLGDFRNLADSIADMRRRRQAAREAAETARRNRAAGGAPRSWLDEVRATVDRRIHERNDPAPSSEAREIARLTEMVEALQARVARLERDGAARAEPQRAPRERPVLRLAAPAPAVTELAERPLRPSLKAEPLRAK